MILLGIKASTLRTHTLQQESRVGTSRPELGPCACTLFSRVSLVNTRMSATPAPERGPYDYHLTGWTLGFGVEGLGFRI